MKKIVLASLMSTFALSVSAEDDVVTEGSPSGATFFDGGYLGLGIGGGSLRNKLRPLEATEKDKSVEMNKTPVKLNGKNFFGVLALGGGKAFCGKWYLGGEVSLDFGKSKTKKKEASLDFGTSGTKKKKDYIFAIKNRGVTPELALRFGYVANDTWLIYVKPSLCFTKTTVKDGEGKKYGSISKPGGAVALGVERSFREKFTARMEVGHEFKGGKKLTATIDDISTKLKVKSSRGFIIRALVTYNFGHLIHS
jgi:hypothetical protein